jgi:hypothetical protein
MLSVFISIPVAALGAWLVWRSIKFFRHHKADRSWWVALAVILVGGGYLGFRLGCLDLRVSPSFRWVGLPLPIGFFQLEGDRWTDFVPPPPIQWLNLLADILVPIIVLLALLLLAWRWGPARSPADSGANPQGGANGRQPGGPEDIPTSAAAAARRSP